jgi:hypothetical protein
MPVIRDDFKNWIVLAIRSKGGSASLIEVAKYVWENYKSDLQRSGDMFFKWQYEVRWAATALRKEGKLMPADHTGIWRLK